MGRPEPPWRRGLRATPTLTGVSSHEGEQLALFAGIEDRHTPCPATETDAMLSPMRDKRPVARIDTLVKRLRAAPDLVEQARLASQLRDRAEALVAETVREANDTGLTWREIGARMGVPFQTLYRRYGAAEPGG